MNGFKCKRLLITCSVIIVVIFWFIVVNAIIKNTPDMSGNGRDFCMTFPEGLILQTPPPKNKLIKFMNKKYGIKFEQYNGLEYSDSEKFSEYGFRYSHISARDFDRYYNGIIVSTNEYPGHYFFVCDYYGEIHDDYGCHLVESEAEQIIENKLSDLMDFDLKVALHPTYFQDNVFSEKLTSLDYLLNGNYIIKIFIYGDGENAEKEFEKIAEFVRPYWDDDTFMFIYYLDGQVYDSIYSNDYNSYSGNIKYKKMGQGWGYDDMGEIRAWAWISE